MTVFFLLTGQLKPYIIDIGLDHIIRILQVHFLELDMLKPGEEEFKKYVRLVNNMVLAIQNILFIAKI